MTTKQTGLTDLLTTLDKTLTEYLVKKAPALPDDVKELLVKIAPWLTAISLIFSVVGLLFLLGLGAVLAPLAFLAGAQEAGTNILFTVFAVITTVLTAMALPGLFNRTRTGWTYLYYSCLVGGVLNIVTFNIGGLLIGTLLGLYILFQVKSYYK